MNPDSLEQTLRHTPFRRFQIHYLDKTIWIDHPEQVLFNATKDTVVVAALDGAIHILDTDHIGALTLPPRRPQRKPAAP